MGNVGVIRVPFRYRSSGGAILAFLGPGAIQMGRRIDVRLKHEAAVARDEAIHIAESHLLLGICIPSSVGVIRVF